jgi:hypothetical protein
MISKFSKFILCALLSAAFSICVQAQMCSQDNEQKTIRRTPQKEEVPQGIKENLAKMCIEQQKKEYAEMLKRGEEALKLSEDLEKAFAANNSLSAEDRKKLERLEKIVKKIRGDLGGGDDDKEVETGEDNSPLSMSNAFKVLQENTVKLVDELKKATRHTISAVAIHSSNVLLKVVKFLRFGK